MINVYVVTDERWPNYTLFLDDTYSLRSIEIPEEFYQEYVAAVTAYETVQDKLYTLLNPDRIP
jgi:hypothetical protein